MKNLIILSRLFWRGCRALCYLLYFKFTNANVVSRFRQMLAKFPDRVMYVNATNDEEWTFQQVIMVVYDYEVCSILIS